MDSMSSNDTVRPQNAFARAFKKHSMVLVIGTISAVLFLALMSVAALLVLGVGSPGNNQEDVSSIDTPSAPAPDEPAGLTPPTDTPPAPEAPEKPKDPMQDSSLREYYVPLSQVVCPPGDPWVNSENPTPGYEPEYPAPAPPN